MTANGSPHSIPTPRMATAATLILGDDRTDTILGFAGLSGATAARLCELVATARHALKTGTAETYDRRVVADLNCTY